MKKVITLSISLIAVFGILTFLGFGFSDSKYCNSNSGEATDKDLQYYTSNLPFKMPEIKPPQFGNRDFRITDYGAKSDGLTKNTDAY